MAAYPDAPPSAYDGSQKPPPMTQHYATAYLLRQPPLQSPAYFSRSQTPQASPGLTSAALSYHDSVVSYPKSPMASSAPSTHSVASYSVKYDARKESMVASEFEKHISHNEPTYPQSVMSRDPEKRVLSTGSPRRSAVRNSYPDVERPLRDNDGDEPVVINLQAKAFSILLYLSLFNPLISFAILFWTLLALLLSVFLLPVRAILRSTSIPSLTDLILPALRLQLRFVYSTHVSPDAPSRPAMVLLIHILSPALSFIFCACSWVIALFWFFSAVLGDPAGEDGHNDGKAAVLWIRAKWEAWLRKGLLQ